MTTHSNGWDRSPAASGAALRTPSGVHPGQTPGRPRTDPWPARPEDRQRSPQQVPPPPLLRAQPPVPQRRPANGSTGRALLGVVAFVVLAVLSLPVHVLALFFAFVEFASPGDTGTALLLVFGTFAASFAALLITATVSQLIGGYAQRWRARITFAVVNALLALGVALLASLTLF